MSDWAWMALGICLCLLAFILFFVTLRIYRQDSKEMDRLEEMLLMALEGKLEEKDYDETRLSRLESRFVRFLSGSALARSQLEIEQQKIKELIGDISHQTKTPLSNILLYTQLLEETELSGDQQELASRIAAYGDKLNWLIQSLVKMSRLENELIQLQPQPRSVISMLEEVVSACSTKAGGKNIELTLLYPEEKQDGKNEMFYILADRKWTVEALYNIVDNAVKYTPIGGKVTVSIKKYQMFLRINIQDNGMGIPKEEQTRIFGRFYRGSRAKDAEGVGIGLYLARQIISQEGGYIRVESGHGEGALFSVYLRVPEQEGPILSEMS